jgi:hypothetical protein
MTDDRWTDGRMDGRVDGEILSRPVHHFDRQYAAGAYSSTHTHIPTYPHTLALLYGPPGQTESNPSLPPENAPRVLCASRIRRPQRNLDARGPIAQARYGQSQGGGTSSARMLCYPPDAHGGIMLGRENIESRYHFLLCLSSFTVGQGRVRKRGGAFFFFPPFLPSFLPSLPLSLSPRSNSRGDGVSRDEIR